MTMLQTLAIIGILIAGMMGQLSQVLQDLLYLGQGRLAEVLVAEQLCFGLLDEVT